MQTFFFMKRLLWMGVGLLVPGLAWAGIEPSPATGARAISLGHAYVGVWGDYWSLYHNPAGIAGVESVQLGAYVERRFNLRELTYGSAGAVLPIFSRQAVGLDVSSFGFDAYRENRVGASYAINVLEVLSLGVKLNYSNLNIAQYGSTSAFSLDVGLNTALTDQLSVGFHAYNISQSRIVGESFEEDMPTVFTAGVAYQPSEKVLVVVDVQKDVDHPTSFRGGVEYAFAPSLAARVGVSTEPLTWNLGLGLSLKQLQLDAAFGYHERLGYTPHISMSFAFN